METPGEERLKPDEKRDSQTPSQKSEEVDKIIEENRLKKSSGQVQYPSEVGHHGTDNEKDLNPEE